MKKRSGWTLKRGRWTRSLGHRGCRVRLFQKRRDGKFYRSVWRNGREDVACLFTADRDEADRMGQRLFGLLLSGETPKGPVRLGDLCGRFLAEAPQHLDNKELTRKDTAARVVVLAAFFGRECDVSRLEGKDQAAYVQARLRGAIALGAGSVTPPARMRSVQADLNVLHAMLRWATTVRTRDGSRWLESNPLQGVPRPKEKNPRRPVATWDRYLATSVAMRDLRERSATEEERLRWLKMELALTLAEATGRRLGSIRCLTWEEIDFDRRTIRWRAEYDKKGRETTIPYPGALFEALRGAQRALGAIGGWVFAGERKPAQPMDRHLFDKWLTVAEQEAGLPKLEGGLWHPYRRAWATSRKHLPIKDVAAAGGWVDTETLLTCYQHPDAETLLSVTASERKIREVVF